MESGRNVVTRFAPTCNNGPLHFGHFFTAIVTILWTKQQEGKCFIKAEFQAGPDRETELQQFDNNVTMLKKLFPGLPVFSTLGAAEWVCNALNKPEIKRLKNPMFIRTAMDAAVGVTDLIRAHDWSASQYEWESEFWTATEQAFFTRALLEKLTGCRVRTRYTPVIVIDGVKLTKKFPTPRATLEQLLTKHNVADLYEHVLTLVGGPQIDIDRLGRTISIEAGLDRIAAARSSDEDYYAAVRL